MFEFLVAVVDDLEGRLLDEIGCQGAVFGIVSDTICEPDEVVEIYVAFIRI